MDDFQVLNPATGEIERTFPTASDAEVEQAVASAHTAYLSWRNEPLERRAEVMRAFAQLIEGRREELATVISREMGKRLVDGMGELQYGIDIPRYYADHGAEFLADEPRESNTGGKAYVRKSPMGVLLGVLPWNYPYYQAVRFAVPNLMAGNTVVVKHAVQCPESALMIESLFREAGLPSGAYVNVFADHDQVETIIADPRVQGVSVTGSERAGSAIAAVAGKHLKKVVLELGGSDPYLVLDTDDLPGVVFQCMKARMSNAGQSCNGAKRFLVMGHLYDDFVQQLTALMGEQQPGDPFDPNSNFGPLSSRSAVAVLAAQVEDAAAAGATVHVGGAPLDGAGAYFPATVLSGVTPSMRAYREELFGPVAVVYRVDDIDSAIELANDSPFGLGAAVFHRDVDTAESVANRLDTGMVWINEREGGSPSLPFGGTKASGTGRELGPEGIGEFVNRKLIHLPS